MRYEFLLNGDDITSRVALGANIKERFAEELDVGSVTISYLETEETIKVLGHLEILKYDKNDTLIKRYDMLVTNDSVEPITKDNNLFRHELSLIELTHKLDYYVVNALGFTQPVIGEKSAPFEQEFKFIDPEENVELYDFSEQYFSIELPEIQKFFDRIYDEQISFDAIGKALIWEYQEAVAPGGGASPFPLLLLKEADIMLKVYRDTSKGSKADEVVLQNHNISDTPITLDDLVDDAYFLEFKVDESFTLEIFKGTQFEGEVVEASRTITYQTIVSFRPRYTMYDVIKRIRDTYPLERADLHEQTRVFDISQELKERLEKIPAPQLYFNKLTTRESINSALRYVNAVCRLVSDNGDYELIANFFNERRGEFLFSDEVKFQKEASQSANDYASNNRAFLANTIASNNTENPSVKEIGENFFKGLRSEQYQMLPENGVLKLQYDIFRLLKITARIKTKITYRGYEFISIMPTMTQDFIEEIEVDLTPYVLEQTVYDILDPTLDVFGTSGNFNTYGKIPNAAGAGQFFRDKRIQLANYKYRSNFINFGGAVGSIYQRTILARIMESAVTEHYALRVGRRLTDSQGNYVGNFLFSDSQFIPTNQILGRDNSPLSLSNTDYLEEITFNVEYIAIENTIDDAHKEDTEEVNKYTEKIINNNERVINYERAAVSNYGISQRLGVPTKKYGMVKKSDETEDVEQIGFVNDRDEVVVEKDNILYKDHEVYAVETSKDFNRLAKFIAVDRQFRPTEIPQTTETLDRQDIYTEYIEYSTGNENITPRFNDTFLGTTFLQTFFNTLRRDESLARDYVKGALVRTDGFLQRYPDKDIGFLGQTLRSAILIPVISLGGKNNLSFEFKFKSNINAGDSISENREAGLDTIADWWNGVSTQIAGWLTSFLGDGEEYSPRPYGLWRQFVTYGNENGEFGKLHFTLLTDFNQSSLFGNSYFSETKNFPLVTESATGSNYFGSQDIFKVASSGSPLTFNQAMVVNKDVSEVYSFKYQVTLVPTSNQDNRDVIIGEKLTSENLLVFPWEEKQLKLYLYTDPNKVHGTFDFEIANTPDSIVDLNVTTFGVLTFAGRDYGIEIKQDLTNIHHWAIADEDGNLYLANNTNNKYVFFEPQNKRSTIDYDW